METVGEIAFHRSGSIDPTLAAKNTARVEQPQQRSSSSPRALELSPGAEVIARIKLADAELCLPGDRFIIRQFSPVVTIGGGVVLDAAQVRGSNEVDIEPLLRAVAAGDAGEVLTRRIARRRYRGLTMAQTVSETGWRREVIESHLAEFLAKGTVLRFGDLFFDSAAMAALSALVPKVLAVFHKENPLVPGMGKETLREKFALSSEVFSEVIDSLLRGKKIEVAGDLAWLSGHGVVLKDEEAESKKTIEAAFATAGLKVPALPEVITGLKVDKSRAQKIVTLLLRDKVLIKISDDLVFHRGALEELRRQVTAFKLRSAKIDVGKFKEMTGVSRKYAIPLLEYLDRERVTRRVGDAREIL
jgi:selenocysteine-specific elongation factor